MQYTAYKLAYTRPLRCGRNTYKHCILIFCRRWWQWWWHRVYMFQSSSRRKERPVASSRDDDEKLYASVSNGGSINKHTSNGGITSTLWRKQKWQKGKIGYWFHIKLYKICKLTLEHNSIGKVSETKRTKIYQNGWGMVEHPARTAVDCMCCCCYLYCHANGKTVNILMG